MRVISLFAGIGGFDLGFERAGMEIVAHVEIDPQCRKLLQQKWPDAVCLDDVRTAGRHNLPDADVICGGFPCQDLSVAGKRAGLEGKRSGLFYEMLRIVDEIRPAYLIWENVPGLLSSDSGRDLERVFAALVGIGYSGCTRVLDAQWFGVAQRRRRVFGVFARRDIGAERCIEILSLAKSLSGDAPTRRELRQRVAGTPTGGVGIDCRNDREQPDGISGTLQAKGTGGHGLNHINPVAVAGTLAASGAGLNRPAGQGNELDFCIPVAARMTAFGEYVDDGTASTLKQRDYKDATDLVAQPVAVCFQGGSQQDQILTPDQISPTLAHSSNSHSGHHQPKVIAFQSAAINPGDHVGCDVSRTLDVGKGGSMAVAFKPSHSTRGKDGAHSDVTPPLSADADKGDQEAVVLARESGQGYWMEDDKAGTLRAEGENRPSRPSNIAQVGAQVRRLTPRECERLQGFPDDWTAGFSDSVRYRMLGNAVCVNVAEWIGKRIMDTSTLGGNSD